MRYYRAGYADADRIGGIPEGARGTSCRAAQRGYVPGRDDGGGAVLPRTGEFPRSDRALYVGLPRPDAAASERERPARKES